MPFISKKSFVAVIHTSGQDVMLLQDGKHCITLNYEKVTICIFIGVPFFSVVAISSLPLSRLSLQLVSEPVSSILGGLYLLFHPPCNCEVTPQCLS